MEDRINIRLKDRLFCRLFGSEDHKEWALDLYNAVNNTEYTNPDDLTITTMEDTVFMNMKNDVSFLIDDRMSLYEHQSTPSKNMCIRGLLYFSGLYDAYINDHDLELYGNKRVMLPTPKYIVFYNGEETAPDRTELKLTDSFYHPEEACMELTATVLNINAGSNRELMEKCRILHQYANFIQSVRHYKKTMSLAEAVSTAINDLPPEDELTKYLLHHKSEVIRMLLTEYNEAETMRRIARDEREEGRIEGLKEGRIEGHKEGLEEGHKEGFFDAFILLVTNGILTAKEAASQAGISEAEFLKKLDEKK